jgi:hypothetical protein
MVKYFSSLHFCCCVAREWNATPPHSIHKEFFKMFRFRHFLVLVAMTALMALYGCGEAPTEPSDNHQLERVETASRSDDVSGVLGVDHESYRAPHGHHGFPPAHGAPDLALMRSGTARYHRLDRALAEGFIDPSGELECVAHPDLGAMGVHFVNFERYGDLAIDPARPEILLYEPDGIGGMKLVAVEFAVNAEDWHDLHGDDVYPEVAGMMYDPPNPEAPNPIVQSSYTLHVWVWKNNPSGMFFPYNPRVVCP